MFLFVKVKLFFEFIRMIIGGNDNVYEKYMYLIFIVGIGYMNL